MASSVLMTIEGTLADDMFKFPQCPSIPDGVVLFHALATAFPIILSTFTATHEAAKEFLQYVCGCRVTAWRALWTAQENESPIEAQERHLQTALAQGPLAFYVTANPAMALYALDLGVTPLCCPHPAYARSSFLPHTPEGLRTWADIEAQVIQKRLMRLGDSRSLGED